MKDYGDIPTPQEEKRIAKEYSREQIGRKCFSTHLYASEHKHTHIIHNIDICVITGVYICICNYITYSQYYTYTVSILDLYLCVIFVIFLINFVYELQISSTFHCTFKSFPLHLEPPFI